ncbi:ATP-binding protein [Caulobacter endophyticus]|uniref:ATP-binding protein n=1 Tax=Caulobacter endophyticus TaxID=2172652 RepID=UPI00240F8E29|nr:ATP-binding protein [Caulobacter endophyticus]MDG2528485.1 ATP-binding protein [Caulobacter endophyticus]
MSRESAAAPDPQATALDVLRKALSEAWAVRPEAERRARAAEIDHAPSQAPAGPDGAEVLEIETIAALTGPIAPQLLKEIAEALGGSPVELEALATRFDRSSRDRRWLWTLRADRRFLALGVLAQGDAESRRLSLQRLTKRLPPASEAEAILRQLIGGEAPSPQVLADILAGAPARLAEAWAQALSWARSRAFDPQALLAVAQRRIAIQAALEGYDHLLSAGFHGREAEIAEIHRFVDATPNAKRIPILSIDGIGGAGKSTLLAAALRPRLVEAFASTGRSPMFVTMDFDRRLLIEGGELELSFELSRQIGLYAPHLADSLARLRERSRRQQTKRGETVTLESAADISDRRSWSFNDQMADVLLDKGLPNRTLILVLDTFEEWERDGGGLEADAPLTRIVNWIREIGPLLDLAVGVIVSGRTPRNLKGFEFWRPAITLGDLPAADARRFLRGMKLPAKVAVRIQRAVGGNPLVLKLAAHYYTSLPPGRRAGFLNDEAEAFSGMDRNLVLGVLYQRFLNHIADPDARKLAYPGLALRQVTPVLIQEVLAEPCKLGDVSDSKAKTLLKQLGDEVWLVERRGEVLRHRPQIRAAMLDYMRKDKAQYKCLRAVHARAAEWWRGQPGEDARLEATYHRLALMGRNDILDSYVFSADHLARLTPDLDDFEPSVAAQVRLVLGLPLSEKQACALPQPLRGRWANARAEGLVARGSPKSALSLWRRHGVGEPVGDWRCQAAFQGLVWDDWIFDPPAQPLKRLKYHVLLTHVSPNPAVRDERCERLWNAIDESRRAIQDRVVESAQIENAYFLSLLPTPAFLPVFSFDRRFELRSLDPGDLRGPITANDLWQLRALGARLPLGRHIDVLKVLNGAFRPSTRWLKAVSESLTGHGYSSQAIDHFTDRLTSEMALADPERTSSTILLGHWANRFAETLVRSIPRNSPTETLRVLPSDRGLDPEWRLPLRLAFSKTFKDSLSLGVFSDALRRALDPLPSDFVLGTLYPRRGETWRWPWGRVVEFLDRADALPRLLTDPAVCGHHALRPICDAYLSWYELRRGPPPPAQLSLDQREPI